MTHGIGHTRMYCDRCDAERARKALRLDRLDRRDRMRRMLTAVLPPRYASACMRRLSPRIRAVMDRLPADSGGILYGPTGRGKSFTLAAYIRRWLLTGRGPVIRTTWDDLLVEIRSTYRPNAKESEATVLKRYRTVPRLVIEDLGATVPIGEEESTYSIRTLTMLIDWRIEHCLPTYFTTNKAPQNLLDSFDHRIASRLRLFGWVGVGGADKRQTPEQRASERAGGDA